MLQLSERFESRKILTLLSRALPYYLSSWRDIDENTGLFGSLDPEVFNMRAVQRSSPVIEYVICPHVQVLCILASYVRDEEYATILQEHIPIEEARAKLAKGLRWVCETHLTGSRDVEEFLERKRWGENWRSSVWASLVGLCAHLAREVIDEGLMSRVREVVAFEADRFIDVIPPSGCETDTKLQENAQDAMVIAWAVNLNPGHPHLERWERSLAVWAVNIASCIADKADHTSYLDRSLSHYVYTQTLYPDMTAENHGFFHPELLSYGMWVVLAMAAYSLNGKEPPESLRRKHHQQTFDVLLRFCLPTGMVYAPGGHDLPLFVPHPFALAWGLWNNDPRAVLLLEKLLSWMETVLGERGTDDVPWVLGFPPAREGWVLYFQSLVGFELATLAVLPFPEQVRLYSSGQIESAVDTRQIYPYVQVCYRRNIRTTRSVAWKALGRHPAIGLAVHSHPELVAPCTAALLGIPSVRDAVKDWRVAFHQDRLQKDGFDAYGQVHYLGAGGEKVLSREIRVVTWGDEGLVILDRITAERDTIMDEQFLSPIHLVNDSWTGNRLRLASGSLVEVFEAEQDRFREVSCPSFWASVEDHLLIQFLWERTKGLVYVPGGQRNAPLYWNNCRLDMLAVHVGERSLKKGEMAYGVGFFVGAGKGPRPFKSAGSAGELFKGLVIMDGRNTLGLD
jgi:hypothetical protein